MLGCRPPPSRAASLQSFEQNGQISEAKAAKFEVGGRVEILEKGYFRGLNWERCEAVLLTQVEEKFLEGGIRAVECGGGVEYLGLTRILPAEIEQFSTDSQRA